MRNTSCMSVMKVLISVPFSGLLTDRALNRAMEMSLARVGLVCRGIVIRFLKFTDEGFFEISLESGWENTGGNEFSMSSSLQILATTARALTW